jgi:hypothetical protein
VSQSVLFDLSGPPKYAQSLAEPLSLRPPDAALALGVSERWLWQHSHPRGCIPCAHVGSLTLYPVDLLRDWLREQAAPNKEKESESQR